MAAYGMFYRIEQFRITDPYIWQDIGLDRNSNLNGISHSIQTDSERITINSPGTYLINYKTQAWGHGFINIRLTKNGIYIPKSYSQGQTNIFYKKSDTITNIILLDLSENDYITLQVSYDGSSAYPASLLSYASLYDTTPIPCVVMTVTKVSDEISTPEMTGNLYIDSTPQGAKITLNNIDRDVVTPALISNLTPGTYSYKLSLLGYNDYIELANVFVGQTTTIYAIMTKTSTGCHVVNSLPKDGDIYINDVYTNVRTPATVCDIPIGEWLVRIEGTFETPITGRVVFTSVPKEMKIYIDGIDTNYVTPKQINGISPGIHTYSLIGKIIIK